MNSTEINKDDPLIQIFQRNAFYKRKFHFIFLVFILSLIVIGVLIGVLVYLIKNPTRPLYFVTDDVSRLIQEVPVTSPNMSIDGVMDWVIEAVENTFSYDFVNYRRQLQEVQKYFNSFGWRNYMDGLASSNNLIALTERKLVIIAKVVEKPKLVTEGILSGAYAYKFQLPLLITYMTPPFNEKSQFQNPVLVDIIVRRESILTSYRGLGIVQIIGNFAYTPAAPNIALPPA